jgi:hypothetical protein
VIVFEAIKQQKPATTNRDKKEKDYVFSAT